MKYFIFTCLVAVALAKHVVKDQSIEESARIIHRNYKQDNDVSVQTIQDSASSSSSEESEEKINDKIVQTEEQKVNLNEQKKIKQFFQDFSCPQFCLPVAQQQTDMNQWAQGQTIRNIPNQESISIFVKEILKKIIDMVKSNQIHQFNIPQFPQAVQQQVPVTYWNTNKYYTNPYAPYVV
ncbi:alpha-S2-casein-like A [Peromyscus maniculatus bairdii]|uniref:alpha-S2-casein-like A n=1 Tax=Peromyscus maniculatus bairdii TaxID=230844 RepID=UPI00077DA27E|nr:alpha-S2-casein-like A isoform X1 [Peromyscus maniculatus bairdii]